LWWVFPDRVSWTICPGWLPVTILLISASWVARITGMSHLYPAKSFLMKGNDEELSTSSLLCRSAQLEDSSSGEMPASFQPSSLLLNDNTPGIPRNLFGLCSILYLCVEILRPKCWGVN
jgi:hypothetical protein